MPYPLLLNEIMKAIAWGIGIFVVIEFVRTKDGVLRKIMIAYFSIEVFIYMSGGIDTYLQWKHRDFISELAFSDIMLIPKDLVKIWLLWYLVRGRKKRK